MSKKTQMTVSSLGGTEKQPMNLFVSDDLQVTIIPNDQFEFLMTSKEVAKGYGVSVETIRGHKHYNPQELKEGHHFISAFEIQTGTNNKNQGQFYWTKQGVVRLGFFVKSERGIQFRDWAEKTILKAIESPKIKIAPAQKRKHNRLTADRLLSIMSDVALIEDKELRVRLRDKIMGKEVSYE